MSKYNNLKLEYQLCFALYTATHAITRAYRNTLEKSGLTYTQYLVMLVLWEKDGVSVSNIANQLGLDSATLTPILKRIESAGFINRIRNVNDERLVEVFLTNAGCDLQHEIASVQKAIECKTGLSSDEFIQLRESLYKLTNNINCN